MAGKIRVEALAKPAAENLKKIAELINGRENPGGSFGEARDRKF